MGMFSCAEDTGTVEVTYTEAKAIYFDIDAIRATPLEGDVHAIFNPGKIFIGDEFILIGEEDEGIHVLDNTDRNNPVQTSFINIPGNKEYYVDNNTIYAESYYDMLKIDISNPNQPQLISRSKNAIQAPLLNEDGLAITSFDFETKTIMLDQNDDFYQEIVDDQIVYYDFALNVIPESAVPTSFAGNSNGKGGTVNRVAKYEGYVYLISNDIITVINDNNFDNDVTKIPSEIDDMETIYPYKDKLFIGSRSAMVIYDVSTPNQPRKEYDFEHVTSCDPVLPHGDAAYVTLRSGQWDNCPGTMNALITIDISDLDNPRQASEVTMSSPYGMIVIGNQLYVGEGKNGLSVFNINDANNPEFQRNYDDVESYDIITDPSDDNILFIAGPDGLSQFIINADQSLDLQSTIQM